MGKRDITPIDYVQQQYGLSDYEMMEIFGTDAETQRRMLRRRPDLIQAVRDMESYF